MDNNTTKYTTHTASQEINFREAKCHHTVEKGQFLQTMSIELAQYLF